MQPGEACFHPFSSSFIRHPSITLLLFRADFIWITCLLFLTFSHNFSSWNLVYLSRFEPFHLFHQVILSSSCLISICVVSPLSQSSLCLTFPFKYISTFLFFFSRVSFISVSLLTLFLHGDFLPADNFFLHPSTAIFHISSSAPPPSFSLLSPSLHLCVTSRGSAYETSDVWVYTQSPERPISLPLFCGRALSWETSHIK